MLEWIFVQIVLKAKELWLINFWTVSLDWTKIYANASKNKNNDLEWLDKKISKLFDQADEIDKFEAKLYFTTLEDWKKKYIQIAKNLKKIFKENDDRLYSKEWKEIYKKISWDVENVFWNIKMNLKFERFSLRWFKGVQIEWNLITMAHNLGKIMKFKAI